MLIYMQFCIFIIQTKLFKLQSYFGYMWNNLQGSNLYLRSYLSIGQYFKNCSDQRSFFFVYTKAWNDIPQHIKSISTLALFKTTHAPRLVPSIVCDHRYFVNWYLCVSMLLSYVAYLCVFCGTVTCSETVIMLSHSFNLFLLKNQVNK